MFEWLLGKRIKKQRKTDVGKGLITITTKRRKKYELPIEGYSSGKYYSHVGYCSWPVHLEEVFQEFMDTSAKIGFVKVDKNCYLNISEIKNFCLKRTGKVWHKHRPYYERHGGLFGKETI